MFKQIWSISNAPIHFLLRLTFYVCSIGFSSPMLFDDRKFPYHLMIQNFVLNGGQDAFFNCFKMAVGQNDFLETNELPDGIIEFLDSWLLLLQKMANPQTLLDSPHSLPSKPDKDYVPFDPIQYLIRTHKVCYKFDENDYLQLLF